MKIDTDSAQSPPSSVAERSPHPVMHVLHGLLMGAADSVPGVSGGTMALIVGIYEDLLESIGQGFRAILSLLRLDVPGTIRYLTAVRWRLILPLGVGIGSALLVAAEFIPALLETHPESMRGLFLGMVAASIAIPWRRIEDHSRRLITVVGVAAVLAFLFSGLPANAAGEPGLLRVLLSASIAICAMILPGVSGAFLLEVLGMYEPTLTALHDRDLLYIATFGAGAVAGLGSFALLLTRLLKTHHDATMAALVGLMLGSLRALWPWQGAGRTLEWTESTGMGLQVAMIAAAGFALVTVIEWFGRRRPAD